jgi:hypothetical protein
MNAFTSNAYNFKRLWVDGAAIEKIVLTHPMRFDADAIRQEFFLAADGPGIPVISHEALSGTPSMGRYYGFEVADRLKSIFGEAKIIIGIREQKSIIRSLYDEYIIRGGTQNLEQFIGTKLDRPGYRPLCRIDNFEYNLLISKYIDLFGKSNVIVMPLEILRTNKDCYMRMLLDFTGAEGPVQADHPPRNVGRGAFVMEIERRINHVLKFDNAQFSDYKDYPLSIRLKNRSLRIAQKYLPKNLNANREKRYKALISQFVGPYFQGSNTQTARITGLDLEALGYDMG